MPSLVSDHFDNIASQYDKWKKRNHYYYSFLTKVFTQAIPPGSDVLDLGCGTAEVLKALSPRKAIGIDFSVEMIKRAKEKFPDYHFIVGAIEDLPIKKFKGCVVLADIFDHVPDIWAVIRELDACLGEGSRVCLSTVNPVWETPFKWAEDLGLKMPEGPHNFVLSADIVNLMKIFNFEIIEEGYRMILPRHIPFLADGINRLASRLPLLKRFCVLQYAIAKKGRSRECVEHSYSVVVPCYNEAGNVEKCADSIPQMGKGTEVIFVDDGSTDGTAERVRKCMASRPHIRLVSYPGNKGKGHAVSLGINKASGDIVMIFDADSSVPARELPNFAYPLASGCAGFVNGSRMTYPMQDGSMRFLNLWGNKFFAVILSRLLGQRITDTLCGTKAFFKKDSDKIRIRGDKWGDFDLLFGAAETGLKIVEVPVHYKSRLAGASKMKRFRHGLQLAKLCALGFYRLKLKKLFA